MLGIFFHETFVAAVNFSFASVIPALSGAFSIQAYKWSLAALLILPQSVLLGMTFPLISGGLIRRWPDRPGEDTGYPLFHEQSGRRDRGSRQRIRTDRRGRPSGDHPDRRNPQHRHGFCDLGDRSRGGQSPQPGLCPHLHRPAGQDRLTRWFTVAALLTGAASFMYELGWIRMLSLVLGSSTHSFELMLSAFIFGLAFGGLYVRRRIERIGDPAAYVAHVMVVTGALAALTLPAYNLTFDFMAWFLGVSPRTAAGYAAFNLVSQLIAASDHDSGDVLRRNDAAAC